MWSGVGVHTIAREGMLGSAVIHAYATSETEMQKQSFELEHPDFHRRPSACRFRASSEKTRYIQPIKEDDDPIRETMRQTGQKVATVAGILHVRCTIPIEAPTTVSLPSMELMTLHDARREPMTFL